MDGGKCFILFIPKCEAAVDLTLLSRKFDTLMDKGNRYVSMSLLSMSRLSSLDFRTVLYIHPNLVLVKSLTKHPLFSESDHSTFPHAPYLITFYRHCNDRNVAPVEIVKTLSPPGTYIFLRSGYSVPRVSIEPNSYVLGRHIYLGLFVCIGMCTILLSPCIPNGCIDILHHIRNRNGDLVFMPVLKLSIPPI